MIYHIDPQSLSILAGPFAPTDTYIRKLTRCGTPEVFSAEELVAFGLVPEVRPELGEYQSYGEPIVTASAVTIPVVDWTEEQIAEREAAVLAEWRASFFIDAWQGRYWLASQPAMTEGPIAAFHGANLLAQIDGLCAVTLTAPEYQRYQGTATWRRNDPQVLGLGAAVGMTDAQIDAWFLSAAEIQ